MADIHLYILSPQEVLADLQVGTVFLPGTVSPFQVLPGHAAMVTSLDKGAVRYTSAAGEEGSVEISSGFAKIMDDEVVVCVEK